MYRFDARTKAFVESLAGVRFLHASFGFPLKDPANYRMRPELGGGVLMDVGCYCLDVVRWVLGEPAAVAAVAEMEKVDLSLSAVLGFEGGAQASIWASFHSPEHQELVTVTDTGVWRLDRPFTWGPEPYVAMVDEFSASILEGRPAPRSLADSIATLRLMERVREAAGV
jgi:predicted dehydrogenase